MSLLDMLILLVAFFTGFVILGMLFTRRISAELHQRAQDQTVSHMTRLSSLEQNVQTGLLNGLDRTYTALSGMTERLAGLHQTQTELKDISKVFVDLRTIFSNKQARGAFGEWQLNALLSDTLPAAAFELQAPLGGNRVDALIRIQDTLIPIDSKFPLEQYQRYLASHDQNDLAAFKSDVRKHISAIREKYVNENTPYGALLFIPSEAVFSLLLHEAIDVVQKAQKDRVHLVSPSTLLVVLSMVSRFISEARLSDEVARVQSELFKLSEEFSRFDERFKLLQKHAEQFVADVDSVGITSKKIITRFAELKKMENSTEA